MNNYRGITYFKFLDNRFFHWLFKKYFCGKNIHLFDECESLDDHTLYCDACGLTVNIESIEEEEHLLARLERLRVIEERQSTPEFEELVHPLLRTISILSGKKSLTDDQIIEFKEARKKLKKAYEDTEAPEA
jgi:hypothetical protein